MPNVVDLISACQSYSDTSHSFSGLSSKRAFFCMTAENVSSSSAVLLQPYSYLSCCLLKVQLDICLSAWCMLQQWKVFVKFIKLMSVIYQVHPN